MGFRSQGGTLLSLEKNGNDIAILIEHNGKYSTLKKKGCCWVLIPWEPMIQWITMNNSTPEIKRNPVYFFQKSTFTNEI